MRYLIWAIRILVFVLVLLFALKNTAVVDVNFYADHMITGVPLIVVMLVAFAVGAAFALLMVAPSGMRRRRDVRRLQREVARLRESTLVNRRPDAVVSPEPAAPLAPL